MSEYTGESLDVLRAVEPYTAEILGLVQRDRDDGRPHLVSTTSGHQVTADYLVRLDGDDYVVTAYDDSMSPAVLAATVRTAQLGFPNTYLTDTPQAQERLAAAAERVTTGGSGELFYAGSVYVTPRDLFDIGGAHTELSRGSVGYTLRQGTEAMLVNTGDILEDPEFFMRAVRAVRLEATIHYTDHFTDVERARHAALYQPVFDNLRYILHQDGVNVVEATKLYADQQKMNPLEPGHITGVLMAEASVAEAWDSLDHCRAASYILGERDHLLIVGNRDSNGRRESLSVIRERQTPQGVLVTTYEQPYDNPTLLVVNQPDVQGDDGKQFERSHRLFLASEEEITELQTILNSLV